MILQKLHLDEAASINKRIGFAGESLYNKDIKKKEQKVVRRDTKRRN